MASHQVASLPEEQPQGVKDTAEQEQLQSSLTTLMDLFYSLGPLGLELLREGIESWGLLFLLLLWSSGWFYGLQMH